jgi:hypothetical protein
MPAAALLLLLLAAPADDAKKHLASDDPRLQAWGAYLVGKHRLKEELPAVRALLVQHKDLKDTSRYVVESALDTLIQLKADVQWQDVKPVSTKYRTHALILLAWHPRRRHDALVELLDGKPSHYEWLALCNLLATQRSPALAVRLLQPLKMYLNVTVRDGTECIGIGGGVGGALRGRGGAIVLDGWPPRAFYTLTQPGAGATLFAPGPHPISYRRKVIEQGRGALGSRRPSGDRNGYRFDYLAELIGTQPKQLAIRQRSHVVVTWRDNQQYLQDVTKARGDIEAGYRRVLDRLQALKLLTKDEASALKPKIKLVISDERKEGLPPLPPLN